MNKTRAQVALLRCENYEHRSVRESIQQGIELLGGIERFTRRGERIILKPNLLIPASAESAVLTHPAVFRAVGEIFADGGADLLWWDSPAVGTPSMAARQCGILREAARLGIKQAEFGRSEKIEHPEGIRNKSFRIARGIIEADGVVSIPKMKTHGLMKITGAFKNSFGCLPGFQKSEYHLRFRNREDFARMLIDLDALVAPRLYIMDGVIAMEGEGPRSGDPKKMNVIIIGTDPVAVDTVFARLININPRLVPCLSEAEKIYGEALKATENKIKTNNTGNPDRFRPPNLNPSELFDLQGIEILGDPIEELIDPTFKIDRSPVHEPSDTPLVRFARNLIIKKPKMIPERCVKCGSCVKVCPTSPKSVDFTAPGGKANPPVFNYSTCIRCYCCHEVCPAKAISLKSLL
jgi:uncharacterized protein (DUF362 family)/Pyruvate/2-oxoacid:ferredoxin oxidoreductase delta subunit